MEVHLVNLIASTSIQDALYVPWVELLDCRLASLQQSRMCTTIVAVSVERSNHTWVVDCCNELEHMRMH